MKYLLIALICCVMTGCVSSPRDYKNFPLSSAEEHQIAADLAWVVKNKYGAASTFEFDYPTWSQSTSFSRSLETALRKQGIAVVVRDNKGKPIPKRHNDFSYTLDTLNNGQLYIKVNINNTYSFQRIWIRDDNDILRPLTTTTVFEGGVDD